MAPSGTHVSRLMAACFLLEEVAEAFSLGGLAPPTLLGASVARGVVLEGFCPVLLNHLRDEGLDGFHRQLAP
eukprot:1175971-Prorocentrum_minimum.AAC.3